METHCRKRPAIVVPSANTYSLPARASIPSASTSASMSFRYYQPPKSKRVESDSEEESSEEERPRASRRSSNATSQQTRRGACTHCKGLKVKCHFVSGQAACQRCSSNKLQCVVVGRKKRRAVATHEELLLKSHKQDVEIANLLRQFDELTMEHRIKAWIDKASSKTGNSASSPRSQHSIPSSASSNLGREQSSWASSYGYAELESPCSPAMKMSANYLPSPTSYLQASPVEKFTVQELLSYFPDSTVTACTKPPEIVARGIIHPRDVHDLFVIYFKFINPYFSVLDPVLHTPERLFWHSHFLFSLICCISTKYSQKYAPMVPVFVEFARDLAGKTLVGGRKTIDECQAYLIQSAYQLPRKQFEDQRTWLTMGLAFSLAVELKLNEPPKDGEYEEVDSKDYIGWERELVLRKRMNRIRTWLNCYSVDATYATQFGKPAMLEVDDYIVRTCKGWYYSPYSLPSDMNLAAHVEMCRVMRHFRIEVERLEFAEKEHPSKRSKVPEVLEIVDKYHNQMLRVFDEWNSRFNAHPHRDEYMCGYRANINRMINAFNRLVVLSYGLQRVVSAKKHESGAGASRDDTLVRQCIETAKEVIKGVIDELYPTGMLRYSLDAHFLFITFAAAHLLSLLRPEMSILLHPHDVEDIDHLVRCLIRVLRSKDVSEDEYGHHAPFHYARYLTKQLKTFSAFLPRHHENDSKMFLLSGGAAGSFRHGSDDLTNLNGTDWARPGHDAMFRDAEHSVEAGLEQQGFFHSGMHCANRTFTDEQPVELSGYPVDFSLINLLHTVNEPQFTKSTPPPGSSDDRSHWWQHMYPVANQTSWPMPMETNAE